MLVNPFLLPFLLHLIRVCASINVVVFLPGTKEEDRRLLNRLAQQLAFRHHRVCTFRAIIIPEKKYLIQPRLHNVRELKLDAHLDRSVYEAVQRMADDPVVWDEQYDASDRHSLPLWTARATACNAIVQSDLMDRLRDELYDVAVVYEGDPCHLAMVHALAVPFVYFDTNGFSDEIVMASGSPWLASLPLSARLTSSSFSTASRLRALWHWFMEYSVYTNWHWLMRALSIRWATLDGRVDQLFGENQELRRRFSTFPSVNEIKRTASAYLVNSDQALELNGRPSVPNVVHVGGLHVEYPRPLFPPYNDTNAMAEGVILFSVGNAVNGTTMPKAMKRAFLKAFSKFPRHRIYWRIGSPGLGLDADDGEIPANINFTQFLPQNDLLAADEAVLFISHGGSNSVLEALTYGVPVLGVPLFGQHYDNLKKMQSKGAAIILPKDQLSAQSIYDAMTRLLKEDRYTVAAHRLSRIYKDRLIGPLETAIHWIERVGRQHGAGRRHLKAAEALHLHQYLMLDVVAALMLLVVAFAKMVMLLARLMIKCIA